VNYTEKYGKYEGLYNKANRSDVVKMMGVIKSLVPNDLLR